MNPTIYASFEDARQAQQAIGSLIRGGVRAEDITLACRDLDHQVQATDLNPAQDDYPRGTSQEPTAFSSAPPASPRDFNRGIEADNYNENYKGDVDRDVHRQSKVDGEGRQEGVGPASNEAYLGTRTPADATRGSEPARLEESDQYYGAMSQTFPDFRADGPGNTTGDPSYAGGGTRYAGIAATANAAANPGGMSDFLWNALPEDVAETFQQHYDGGKAIVIVRQPTPEAEAILRSLHANSIHRQGYLA